MNRQTTVHVSLELQVGSDPLRGELEVDGGGIRPFAGWLELIEALDSLAADPPASEEGQTDVQ